MRTGRATAIASLLALGCAMPVDAVPVDAVPMDTVPMGAVPVDAVGERREAITQGWVELGDPAVVALMRAGAVTCSGTLVAPDVVLTAAHCVDLLPPEQVIFGDDPATPQTRIEVRASTVHPGYERATLAHDIAVVELAHDAEVEPAALPTRDLDEGRVGSQARIVGFGLTAAGGDGELRKRSGFSRVAALDHATFQLDGEPSQPCLGDSGGPTFLRVDGREPVVGVHSGGSGACAGGARETRVDAHRAFLAPFLERAYSAPSRAALTGGCRAGGGPPGSGGAWFGALIALLGLRRRRVQGGSGITQVSQP